MDIDFLRNNIVANGRAIVLSGMAANLLGQLNAPEVFYAVGVACGALALATAYFHDTFVISGILPRLLGFLRNSSVVLSVFLWVFWLLGVL